MKPVRASQVPNITAVNVAIYCTMCHATIQGRPFWSIRQSAHLHATTCTCAKFLLDDILAGVKA
jgi:hypothetical protein